MVTLSCLVSSYEARMSDYSGAFKAKCDELGFDAVLLDSLIPFSGLPYHNKNHMVNVAFDADFIASRVGVNLSSRRKLFLAGLFHDVNHTGEAKPDSRNIAMVESFMEENAEAFKVLGFDALEEIFPIIQGTNTDFYSERPSFLGGLLRDADVLGWAYVDFDFMSNALSLEFGVDITLEGTREFLRSHEFFSVVAVQALEEAGML